MVDDSHMIFALLDPMIEEGGTFYTVKYAMKMNRQIKHYLRN